MSLTIPVSWVGGRCIKWDQRWIDRLLSGIEALPAGGYRFEETPWNSQDGLGRVLVFPAGDFCDESAALLEGINRLPWCLLIATSDECSKFPWRKMQPWPETARAWVMTPRPGIKYPPGTRFVGEGSPIPASEFHDYGALTRDLDLFFAGQSNHDRRRQALAAMKKTEDRLGKCRIAANDKFLHSQQGELVKTPGADHEYVHGLTRAWLAPAPSGTCTQDSFRFYEALEAGCIPIVDAVNNADGSTGYWEMLGLNGVAPTIQFWPDLGVMAESLLRDRCHTAAHISARWQRYKRDVVHNLHNDVEGLVGLRRYEPPHDAITVLVVTSPVPSNPDLSMIQNLIRSVRLNLPGAEILIGCDAPREENAHRARDYSVFLHRLCVWANAQYNMTVSIAQQHAHESGLLHLLMPEVRTSHVLFMEHDCPLVQPVDFQACLEEMETHGLRHLRFGHEARVLDEHAYLYPFGTEPAGNHIKTVQYSSRPALYTSELMRELLDTYFAPEATCMIESVLYGPWQTDVGTEPAEAAPDRAFADRLRRQKAWKRYRSALWAPGTNLAFSGHVDGRGEDPNVPIDIRYPGGVVPPGAPQPGLTQI